MLLLQNYAKARGPSRWWSERLFQATSRNWLKKVLRMLNAWLMNAMPQKAWTKSRSTFMYHINELKYFLKVYSYSNTSFETLAYCSKNKPKFGLKVPNFILKIDIPSKYCAGVSKLCFMWHALIFISSMQFCFHKIFLILKSIKNFVKPHEGNMKIGITL